MNEPREEMNIEEPGLRDRFGVRHVRFCGDQIVTVVSAQPGEVHRELRDNVPAALA